MPPVSGTADIFFKQVMGLASRGVRVIAAEPPPYWNMKEWCDGFKRLIDYLELDKVHIFGASLGMFLFYTICHTIIPFDYKRLKTFFLLPIKSSISF